jgi:hypothetical protein
VVGICADTVGIIAEPIALEAGSGAVLELTGDLDWLGASHIAVAAWPLPATTVASGADWVAYRPEGDATALAVAPAAKGARVIADLAPGRYLLHLTIAEERGDASYGLLLDIAGDAPAAEGVVVDDPVAMRIGERIVVMGTPWTLEFTEVGGDSRCPTDVTCVWAGEVTLAFLASMEASARELEVTLGPQGEPVVALDDQYVLRILAVTPQPQADVEIKPGAYSALIVVERARIATSSSGVRGVVTVGPQCPVQRADMSCPDRPYAAEMVIRDSAGREVKRVEAGDDGWYEVELAAGVWVLDPLSPAGSPLPVSEPVEFTVEPHSWTVLNVSYDSGIR